MKRQIRNILNYNRRFGFRATVLRTMDKLTGMAHVDYAGWRKKTAIGEREFQRQRKTTFAFQPKIGVLIIKDQNAQGMTERFRKSLELQTYTKYEVYEMDACKEMQDRTKFLEFLQTEMDCDYVMQLDSQDVLEPHALFACVQWLNKEPEAEYDAVYSDDDVLDEASGSYTEPSFKPDYSETMLRSTNYMHEYLLIRKSVYLDVIREISKIMNAQNYEFLLRVTEHTTAIAHVPKVLCHESSKMRATLNAEEQKEEMRALREHYDRIGVRGTVEETEYPGIYRTRYLWDEKPKVSIIIPNKDHISDLKTCIDSLENRNTYTNCEYLIVENNSVEEETFRYYKELEQSCERAKVLYWKGKGFNFSAINNFGAAHAEGEYLLLLNNDTSIINPDCIEELLSNCMREGVGAVGAKLYYEDGTVQHSGVIVGLGGVGGHHYTGCEAAETGHMRRLVMAQDLSAVTAACMMLKKCVYQEVGGLEEQYAVAFNDVDLCMKVRRAGYLIVFTPYAKLNHYESKSRGMEDSKAKRKRFESEVALFENRWSDFLKQGDPYYNVNFRVDEVDFRMNVHVKG